MERPARAATLVAGLVVAGLLLVSTRTLDAVAAPGQLGPGFWPRLVLIGFAAACGLQLLADRRPRGRAPAADEATPPAAAFSVFRLVLAIGCLLAYAVAAPLVGFPLATFAFVAAFMVLAGARGPVGIVATALVGTAVLLYTFVKVVYLPFPKGAGSFERVTLALYRALGIF
jgi:putative tricarboxylic transport membrane protein